MVLLIVSDRWQLTNLSKDTEIPSQEVLETQKALAEALGDDEDEIDASELETSDDDALSDLPSSLLALESIRDEMLALINEPSAFMESLLIHANLANSPVVSHFLSTMLAHIDDIQYFLDIEGLTELTVAHSMGELMYQKAICL
ncbi:hypothetical protein BDR06DRAFT_970373 [Suillus hirtellus]|nr:hypothetical protein BDR06DRAFT_970373 [Suillus hirtellus]